MHSPPGERTFCLVAAGEVISNAVFPPQPLFWGGPKTVQKNSCVNKQTSKLCLLTGRRVKTSHTETACAPPQKNATGPVSPFVFSLVLLHLFVYLFSRDPLLLLFVVVVAAIDTFSYSHRQRSARALTMPKVTKCTGRGKHKLKAVKNSFVSHIKSPSALQKCVCVLTVPPFPCFYLVEREKNK